MSSETRARKPSARHTPAAAKPFSPAPAVLLAVLALVTIVVQRHVLREFFALDDLILFQQASGIRDWPLTPWRWLSGLAWFKAVVPLWGHEPFPYHAASLAVHAVNVLLLHRLAQRLGASPVAAFVGAACFGIARLHFPALLAATSIGELLSLMFLLAALLFAMPAGRLGLALLAMALAVSAKESVMLVPLALVFAGDPERSRARRLRDLLPLLAVGVVVGGALLATGMGSGRLAGEAYRVSLGANMLENAGRLFGWTVEPLNPIPDLQFTTEGAARIALPLAALALTALALRARPLMAVGAIWWWCAVLPVLPLPGRTYLHYLYVPLAGVALATAALYDLVLERLTKRSPAQPTLRTWAVAGLVTIVLAAYNDMLLSIRLDQRMPNVDWPLDPVLRKSTIARRGIEDVREALAGRRAKVAILIPDAVSADVNLRTGRFESSSAKRRYALEAVLDEGRSVQALVPLADTVVFVNDYEPGREGWLYLISFSDSHLMSLGELPGGHARYVEGLLSSGLPKVALDYTQKALADYPGDSALLALRDRAAAQLAATPR